MQEKAGWWITRRRENYKENLLRLKLLPLSLYHELHVLSLFVDIIHKIYSLNWTNYLNVTKVTQSGDLKIFQYSEPVSAIRIKKKVNESDFWTRACYLANKLGSAIGKDVHSTENPKRGTPRVDWTSANITILLTFANGVCRLRVRTAKTLRN